MKAFDPRNVQCPYCVRAKLRAVEVNGQIRVYICRVGCKSVFDSGDFIDIEQGLIYFLAKRRNPDYISKLDSDDVLQNLEKAAVLDQKGVPFHTDTFVLGSKTFEES